MSPRLAAVLEAVANQREPGHLPTPPQALGGLYDLANRLAGDKRAKAIVQGVATAACQHARAYDRHKLLGHALVERAVFARSELPRELGVSRKKADSLLTLLGSVDAGRHAVPDDRAFLRSAEIRKLRILLGDSVSAAVARHILGVSGADFDDLKRVALIPTLPGRPTTYRRRRLEDLLFNVRGSAPAASSAHLGQILLVKAALIAPTLTIGRVCRALAEGRLKCVGILLNRRGLGGVILDREDVLLLSGVPELSFARFPQQNVALRELEERSIHNGAQIRKLLLEEGVPALIQRGPACRAGYYARRDAEAALQLN